MFDLQFHHNETSVIYEECVTESNEDTEDAPVNMLDHTAIVNLINENSFVAIRSPPQSLELFFVLKIVEKVIAAAHMEDSSQEHWV